MLRKLTLVLSTWPSWRVVSQAIGGSTPFGSVLALVLIRRVRIRDVLLLATFLLGLTLHLRDVAGLVEIAKLLIGPVILLYVRGVDLSSLRGLSSLLLLVFLVDAAVGRFVSSGLRSETFLRLEPSHSARAFYAFLLIDFLIRGRSVRTVAAALLFLAFNASLSAAVFTVFFAALTSLRRVTVVGALRLLAAVVFVAASFAAYVSWAPPNRLTEAVQRGGRSVVLASQGQDLSLVLQTLGGPRIAMATAAFATSSPWGYGMTSGEGLREHVADTPFTFENVPYIRDRATATPASYLSQVAFEAGWLVTSVLLVWLFQQRGRGWRGNLTFWFGLLQLALFATTTTPTPWIFLALSPRWGRARSVIRVRPTPDPPTPSTRATRTPA